MREAFHWRIRWAGRVLLATGIALPGYYQVEPKWPEAMMLTSIALILVGARLGWER